MDGDWIKLHRRSIDSRVFSDPDLWRLWCWCLMCANWKRSWKQGREIPPGSFATGELSAAEQLGISGSKWRRGIKRLKEFGMIEVKATNKFTLISLVNWEKYQGTRRTTDEQVTNNRRTSDEPVTTIEEGEEEEERKEKNEVLRTSSSQQVDEPSSSIVEDEVGLAFALQSGVHHMKAKEFAEYVATYKFDVRAELMKAALWLRNNKSRRPRSSTGMRSFLTRWLNNHSNYCERSNGGRQVGKAKEDPNLKSEMERAIRIRKEKALAN